MAISGAADLGNQAGAQVGASVSPGAGRLVSNLVAGGLAATQGREDYQVQFAFRVEIDGIMSAAFRRVGPFVWETAVESVREGGNNRGMVHMIKPAQFGALTLDKGLVSGNNELFLWMQRVHDPSTPFARANVSVVLLAENGDEAGRFNLYNAFISKYQLGGLDGRTDEVAVETMTLHFDYFEFKAGNAVEQLAGQIMGGVGRQF